MVTNFPEDHRTQEGMLFWSGQKRFPKPIRFDVNDEIHIDFIQGAANIYATMFGLPMCQDRDLIKKFMAKMVVPEFKAKKIKLDVRMKENSS